MIAAAIVCAAAFAQAAQTNWSIGYGIQVGGSFETGENEVLASSGWMVYAFDNATYSRDQMIAAISADNSLEQFNGLIAGDGKQTVGGKGIAGDKTWGINDTEMTVTDGKVNGYIVMIQGAETAEGVKVFVSDVYSTPDNSPLATSLGLDDLSPYGIVNATATTTGTWGTLQAVPEPTSGLLLLIGVAGLALRRRRA